MWICHRTPRRHHRTGTTGVVYLGSCGFESVGAFKDVSCLTLPAKFREELAGGLMVTKGQDHSLAVYPKEEFVRIARKAAQLPRSNPAARAFIRNLTASADEQRPDGQGRITITPDHRKYAGLTKECVVIGAMDFLEIWDAEAWARYQADTESAFADASDDFLDGLL